ncbi:MAG: PAS domain S-box protein, partial [Planctomycetales bacterium]|nr:PAS domain S-box protein [Planctomycetales bacterium]
MSSPKHETDPTARRQVAGFATGETWFAFHGDKAFEDALSQAALHAKSVVESHQVTVSYLPDGDFSRGLHAHAFSEKYATATPSRFRPCDTAFWRHAVSRRQVLWCTAEQLSANPLWRESLASVEVGDARESLQGLLIVPVLRRDGGFAGLVQLSDRVEGEFCLADGDRLKKFCRFLAPIFEVQFLNDHLRARVHELKSTHLSDLQGQRLIEASPNGMLLVRSDGVIVQVNTAACRTFRYEREELIGSSVERLVPSAYRKSHVDQRGVYFANPLPRSMGLGRDLRGVRSDGTEVSVEIGLAPFRSDRGDCVIASVVDISERKRQEDERLALDRLFALLVQSVRDHAIIMLDAAGCVQTWNSGAERLLGYTHDEIVGRDHRCFFPDQGPASSRKPSGALPVDGLDSVEEEGWRVRQSGEKFWANVVVTPVRDAQGTLLGFSHVMRDLTTRRRHEAEQERHAAALQAANEQLESFVYIASHDLQEP